MDPSRPTRVHMRAYCCHAWGMRSCAQLLWMGASCLLYLGSQVIITRCTCRRLKEHVLVRSHAGATLEQFEHLVDNYIVEDKRRCSTEVEVRGPSTQLRLMRSCALRCVSVLAVLTYNCKLEPRQFSKSISFECQQIITKVVLRWVDGVKYSHWR